MLTCKWIKLWLYVQKWGDSTICTIFAQSMSNHQKARYSQQFFFLICLAFLIWYRLRPPAYIIEYGWQDFAKSLFLMSITTHHNNGYQRMRNLTFSHVRYHSETIPRFVTSIYFIIRKHLVYSSFASCLFLIRWEHLTNSIQRNVHECSLIVWDITAFLLIRYHIKVVRWFHTFSARVVYLQTQTCRC